jgi:SAM-dependent methyltransferase
MNLLERFHATRIYSRRARRLSELLAPLIPGDTTVLDVGCGDGLISSLIAWRRPDIRFQGVEVLVRDHCHIPVAQYDGRRLPYGDGSYDIAMLVDVLHHTDDPMILIDEAIRVARRAVLIKDHLREGWGAGVLLRFMDCVGNARFGVTIPHNYWPRQQWVAAFMQLHLRTSVWVENLGIYPWPASMFFDRSLHFIARIERGTFPIGGNVGSAGYR